MKNIYATQDTQMTIPMEEVANRNSIIHEAIKKEATILTILEENLVSLITTDV